VRLAPAQPSVLPATDFVTVPAVASGATWLGVGAALTDSTVELIAGEPDVQSQLYDPNHEDGARLNLLRLPLSSTDFSTTWWSWSWNGSLGRWVPPTQAVAAANLADDLVALQPDLSIVGVPWSAPAAMKTTSSIAGGALSAGFEDDFAGLLVDQAEWLLAQGLPLDALAVVNEPGHSGNYPTMTMTDQQLATVGAMVGAAVADEVELWAVDHNWSDRPRVDQVLSLAPNTFDRAAFHCYGGSPSQMAGLPIPAVMTECTGTDDTWTGTFRWDAANLIMGSIEAGSTGLIMWNLALDPQHGPKLPGGCTNCRGLLTIDPVTGSAEPTPEYYALAHLARAADPGAVVSGVQRAGVITTATFLNPDGALGVIGFNDSSSQRTVHVSDEGGTALEITVPGYSYFTARQHLFP
jgi:glucosylceramidase